MGALKEIGIKKALRFFSWTFVYAFFRCLSYPPLRTMFLRCMGARIGKNSVIHSVQFFNFYRGSFKNFQMGDDCFIGNAVLVDLAAPIILGNQVTVAERCSLISHLNVGYHDHPLQKYFPSQATGIRVGAGSFIGVNSVIVDGVEIGAGCFIGAQSLVNASIPANSLVGGNPAKVIRNVIS